ncbi:virion structural protein [Synechococcus phage ACG-2014e]|uniref:Structural protein n=1 Tax=Synechococcus phage ACG-2014e TaxID=1493510 RepID=A0A0E3HHL4_9CAUD|nr:virion structural protein [Synechococcus phage ACG-2014e]YP_010355701.1 virion structural protein [Synechococcus phage ACG-2014e]AIX20552.1 structural protein [Synechococcus phage ACG-2014e]AIX29767.1 structural protein [Synechococcus phage ACG-2014e]AIX45006.1 structural protein [Synechococcus phage ACG-2014e]
MAINLKKFESAGGFSVQETIHIDELHNAKEFNSIEMMNSFFTDSKKTNYILRGVNTATLQLDDVGTTITIENNTMNFITGHFIGVNPTGVVYSGKIESAVYCSELGAVNELSNMQTIIKHDVPVSETWDISSFTATNRFSYSTVRSGTVQTIKWAVSTEVISIAWA